MVRVRHNVELLVGRLPAEGYAFGDPAAAHVLPTDRDRQMIAEIEAKIGPLPLSFRAFLAYGIGLSIGQSSISTR